MKAEPLPEANLKLQTTLLRHAVANALKKTNGVVTKRQQVREKFKIFCKKLDDTIMLDYMRDCNNERLRVFNLCEEARLSHMQTASDVVKPLRKEVTDFDEVIRILVERRNAIDADILKIVKDNSEKWRTEERRLNDEMNKNLEAIAKVCKDRIDAALLVELPEYCK